MMRRPKYFIGGFLLLLVVTTLPLACSILVDHYPTYEAGIGLSGYLFGCLLLATGSALIAHGFKQFD